MTPFLITLAIIAGLTSLALFVRVLTAREGWEDDQGFHFGVRGHSAHNGQAISAGGRKDHGAQH